MRQLWVAFIVIASLGSIYPFNFGAAEIDAAKLLAFLESCCKRPGLGDIIGNFLLFVPIGFTGMFAARPGLSERQRLIFVMTTGVAIALLLQLLQFYLPSRDENLQDVLWNTVGLSVGSGFAMLLARTSLVPDLHLGSMSLVPVTLVGTWLGYRLIPFVPSLDWQSIKNSLKPLLIDIQISAGNILHDVAGWLVVGYLLQHAQRDRELDDWLPALIVGVLCLEVLTVNNAVSASNVLGATIAILLWRGVMRQRHDQEMILVGTLLFALLVSGLAPFVVRDAPDAFGWFPFHGFLGGSMYVNAQSAANKVFLYGSLVYLLWRTTMNRGISLAIGFGVVLSIEWAQIYFAGHTPEITDPLLVVFAALALMALERHDLRVTVAARRQSTATQSLDATVGGFGNGMNTITAAWIPHTVNLRGDQHEFLSNLANEMGGSISSASRSIVRKFIGESAGDKEETITMLRQRASRMQPLDSTQNMPSGSNGWSSQVVNLRPAQVDYLLTLSDRTGLSVSRIIRRIIQRFMDTLEEDHEASK
jgi:VanZ family protein